MGKSSVGLADGQVYKKNFGEKSYVEVRIVTPTCGLFTKATKQVKACWIELLLI